LRGLEGANDQRTLPIRDHLTARRAEPGLRPHTIRALANWYAVEARRRRRRLGITIDKAALDRDLHRLLADYGVLPEFIAAEFKRVMQIVLGVS
jgi:hypothetical protein